MKSRAWLGLVFAVFAPAPAHAQFGAVEALLRNVTDVSFYGGITRLVPGSGQITERGAGLPAYGVEMLFEIGSVNRPAGVAAVHDTTRLVLVRMEVRGSGAAADTVRIYEPHTPAPRAAPAQRLWTFEMGFGYGQLIGFELTDADLEMRGSVRDLPSLSVYATHEASGMYAGLRSGYMKTQGLQVVERNAGIAIDGSGDAFLAGAALGYAHDLGGASLFLETSYVMRYFPSVQWSGDAALRARVPRDLRLSGAGLAIGIQISLRNR